MSAPAGRPAGPRRPGLVAVPAGASPPGEDQRRLRDNLGRVLAGVRWPAFRWQVLAEAEFWGVSGVVREQLLPMPDGRYPSLEALLEVLSAVARGRLRAPVTGPAPGASGLHPAERVVARRRIAPPPHRAPARPTAVPPGRPRPGHVAAGRAAPGEVPPGGRRHVQAQPGPVRPVPPIAPIAPVGDPGAAPGA